MGPFVIADSDEESDVVATIGPPSPKTTTAELGEVVTRASDRSLTAASTDPAFFQSIYNEQNNAAVEEIQGPNDKALADDVHQSSVTTVPDVPFQRTMHGFYHSSITSVADPIIGDPQKGSTCKNMNEWTQITSPGGVHGKEPKYVDPWDVPSSPEVTMALKSSNIHRTPVRRPSSRLSSHDPSLGFHQDQDGCRKRRRLAETHPSPEASNEVNLITFPSSGNVDDRVDTAAMSSIPLPTMPLDHTSPFSIAPQSQAKNIHLSSDIPSTASISNAYVNLLLQQQTIYAVGSSGSATNMNTPRSQIFPSHDLTGVVQEDLDGEVTKQAEEGRVFGRRRNSSPDIISAEAPVLNNISAVPGNDIQDERECNTESQHNLDAEAASNSPAQSPLRQTSQARDEAVPVVPQPRSNRPKKKRGRPKKNTKRDQPETIELTDRVPDAPIIRMQTKKRGRPKKDATLPIAEIPSSPSTAAAKVEILAEQETTVILENPGIVDANRDVDAVEIFHDDVPTERPENSRQDFAAPDRIEGPDQQSTDQSRSEKMKDEKQPKAVEEISAKGGVEKSNKTTIAKQSPTAMATKPLYRVGLSKRSRIAPLLKSVRKP